MKTNLLIACTVLIVSAMAFGRAMETADFSSQSRHWTSSWQKLEATTEKKANEWANAMKNRWSAWRGHSEEPVATRTASGARTSASTSPATSGQASATAAGTVPAAAAANTTAANQAPLTPAQKQFSQIIDATRNAAGQNAVQVVVPARVGTTALPKTKNGVPVFALKQKIKKKRHVITISVKNIPRLDIGTEKQISAGSFMPSTQIVDLSHYTAVKTLPSPAMPSLKETRKVIAAKIEHVAKAEWPHNGKFKLGQMVTHERIAAVDLSMGTNKPLEDLKPIKEFSPEQLLMLAATLLYEKGNKCHVVTGLLSELAKNPQYTEESNFDLGMCAHKMGFHTEAVTRLLRVVKTENVEYTPDAVAALVDNLPKEYDDQVAPVLLSIKNRVLIPASSKDNLHFVIARYADEHGNYKLASDEGQKVSTASPHYADAQYYRAIGLYGDKHVKQAEAALTNLRGWMNQTGYKSDDLKALIAMNLARMYFMQGRYQLAENEYMKVPKDHPLWIEALIEQGWTQLNLDDAAGAIGNMYSLHSPYFRMVYMPESWVVRTIGYINICQYGDAYRALQLMEQKYRGWQKQIQSYLNGRDNSLAYYNTVKNYIRGGSSGRDVDGLPYQVIREIARQRGFTNDQDAVNNLEDEASQYSYVYGILQRDQAGVKFRTNRTNGRVLKLKRDIAAINKHPKNMQYLNEWMAEERNEHRLLEFQKFEGQLYEQARQGYLKMKAMAIARIEQKKYSLVHDAGDQLMAELQGLNKRLSKIFDGNEFLRYEIYAGSGENIRYQVSGGRTAATLRIPSNVKPQKIMHWDFDGEYWQDEIGSYRSTLRNNCPKNPRTARTISSDSASGGA